MSALPPIATVKADFRSAPKADAFCVSGIGEHAEHSVGGSPYGAGRLTSSLLFLRCPLWANSGHGAAHSITSSAVASSVGGTIRPRALAVLRLIVSWYFVGC